MKEKYNLDTFNELMQSNPSDDDVFHYFSRMNKDYNKAKKNGLITEDVMAYLVEFWDTLRDMTDGVLVKFLFEKWHGHRPALVKDIVEFAPKYNEINYNKVAEKLDPIEIRETETLFNAIWEKGTRMEGIISYYDWDNDSFVSDSIEVPRKDREGYKYDFKRICANIIYNRGNMLLKFYSRRGGFEVVGIHVGDGQGIWECLTKAEIQTMYTTNEGAPMVIEDNETVIFLERPEEKTTAENVLYFHK